MNRYDLQELYNKVVDIIDHNDSYHVWHCCGDAFWNKDATSLTFDVYGSSDQGEGADWVEHWGIDSDGIWNDEGKRWKTFEEFKNDWI